jgi:hypothetical protein
MTNAAFCRRWSVDTSRRMTVMQRNAMKVHQLGGRVFLELLLEIGSEHDIIADVFARLEDYAELTPAMVRAAGADRMVPRRLVLVSS